MKIQEQKSFTPIMVYKERLKMLTSQYILNFHLRSLNLLLVLSLKVATRSLT